jgi:hypothetical protein
MWRFQAGAVLGPVVGRSSYLVIARAAFVDKTDEDACGVG